MAATSATEVYDVPSNFQDALINEEKYQQMYQESVENSESFWGQASGTNALVQKVGQGKRS